MRSGDFFSRLVTLRRRGTGSAEGRVFMNFTALDMLLVGKIAGRYIPAMSLGSYILHQRNVEKFDPVSLLSRVYHSACVRVRSECGNADKLSEVR